MEGKVYKRIKKLYPLGLAFGLIILFAALNIYYLNRDLEVVIEAILKDGLPSLIAIVIISMIIELTTRKQDRNRIRENFRTIFQNQVGFNKYVSSYDAVGDGLEKMITDHHEYEIKTVKIMFIGAEQVMIRGILNALSKTQNENVKIEILLLNPDSDLATVRGNSISLEQYQMDIKSNLSSICSYFNDLDADGEFSKENISIRLYNTASKCNDPSSLPSVVMAKFDEEFIAFAPLWNSSNVKNGPLCFVPFGNKIFGHDSKALK